ncbi:MAG: MFS transporter [Roseomonas sp.]|nr:MFS transporter [Roseomonas sp.]
MSEAPRIAPRLLFWGTAITQLVGWGCLFTPFQLMVAPMEAELGWSRVLISGAFTCGLLVSGLIAVPAGRWQDRHGPRGMMTGGALLGAALLVCWSFVSHPIAFVLIWVLLGAAHATCLWGPAMAVVVAEARDVTRSITAITLITGFTGTIFIPLVEALIGLFGWRDALLVLAVIQTCSAAITAFMLRHAGPPKRLAESPPPVSLMRRLRDPVFLGLAFCFAAHAFIGTGLGAHLVLLLRERGWPEATVLLLAAAHGPGQVAARLVLFTLGRGVAMRHVGRFALLLLPIGMALFALAPDSLALTIAFIIAWAVADGLLTILRAAGVAEIMGRDGFGATSGALSAFAVLPRTAAPLALALVWDAAGGYGPVPWLLLAIALFAMASFYAASRPRGISTSSV